MRQVLHLEQRPIRTGPCFCSFPGEDLEERESGTPPMEKLPPLPLSQRNVAHLAKNFLGGH